MTRPTPVRNQPPARTSTPPSTPRWVVVFVVIALILVALFVIQHLMGGGFGNHAP